MFVGEAKHHVTGALEKLRSLSIAIPLRCVDIAIEFHDESFFRTAEVCDEGSDWMLTAELDAMEFAAAQCLPEHSLSTRLTSS